MRDRYPGNRNRIEFAHGWYAHVHDNDDGSHTFHIGNSSRDHQIMLLELPADQGRKLAERLSALSGPANTTDPGPQQGPEREPDPIGELLGTVATLTAEARGWWERFTQTAR